MEEVANQAKEQKQNNSLLQLACARGYLEDVKHLVDMGADIKSRDKKGISTLHFACGQGRKEVVVYLWQRGAVLDWEDPEGRTPLHYATLGGHKEVVDFLLGKGVWTDAYDSLDETVLHIAARKGYVDIVEALLAKGAKTTVRNKRSLTPLGEALVAGQVAAAEILVQQGKPNALDRPRGWSLLHMAAGCGCSAAVKFLISNGADVADSDTEEQLTPLHCAAMAGSLPCAQVLIKAGADATAQAADDRLPIDCLPAKSADNELAKLLDVPASQRTKRPAVGKNAMQRSPAAAAPASAPAAFKALPRAQQVDKVERWLAADDAGLAKALTGFWEEAKRRVAEARTIHQVLQIHKAMIMLHEDDDFQAHGPKPETRAAIEDVRAHPEHAANYATNADVMDVLQKLRRFQSVISANGRHTVPFEQLLVANQKAAAEANARRTQGMRSMLDNTMQAAIAAATADSEADAKRAADTVAAARSGSQAEGTTSDAATPAQDSTQAAASGRSDAKGHSASRHTQPDEGGGDGGGLGSLAGDREPEGGDGGRPPSALLPGRTFTWKAFWKELQWQMFKALVLVVVMMVAMWWQGIPLPWQRHASPGTDPSGIQTEPRAWGDADAQAEL